MTVRRNAVVFIAAMLCAVALLAGLGVWQLGRAAWKGDLLAELDARQAAEPVSLIEALEGDEASLRFRRIEGRLEILPHVLRVHAVDEGTLGYRAVLPGRMDDGAVVLIDAGFVPSAIAGGATAAAPSGIVSVQGYARFRDDRPSAFTPDNKPDDNVWYWWDKPAMMRALGDLGALTDIQALPSTTSYADLSLQLSAPVEGLTVDGSAPRAAAALPRPHDRHAGYAVTWFGLALVVAGALAAWTLFRFSKGKAPDDDDRHIPPPDAGV